MAGSWSDQFIVKIAPNTDVQLCDRALVATVAVILNAGPGDIFVQRSGQPDLGVGAGTCFMARGDLLFVRTASAATTIHIQYASPN
jgi:hypothetical protein